MTSKRWVDLMSHDKKAMDGAMRFVLLEGLGRGVLRAGVESTHLAAVLAA